MTNRASGLTKSATANWTTRSKKWSCYWQFTQRTHSAQWAPTTEPRPRRSPARGCQSELTGRQLRRPDRAPKIINRFPGLHWKFGEIKRSCNFTSAGWRARVVERLSSVRVELHRCFWWSSSNNRPPNENTGSLRSLPSVTAPSLVAYTARSWAAVRCWVYVRASRRLFATIRFVPLLPL